MTPKRFFCRLFAPTSVVALFAPAACAFVQTPPIDDTVPLPKLESVDALGDLQFAPPTTHRFEIDGVTVRFTPVRALPIVDISVGFWAGSAFDQDKRGAANMAATMLTQGAGDLDEDAFIAKKEQLAVALNASASKDRLNAHLRSLSDSAIVDGGVDLLIKALAYPRFDESVFLRNRSQLQTALRQRAQTPSYVASLAFSKAVFGDHPYAHPVTGSVEDVEALQIDDVRRFADAFLVRQNAAIAITGDLTLPQAQKIAERIVRGLKSGKKADPIPKATASAPARLHIDHPSPQNAVVMGNLTAPFQNDPAFLQRLTDFEVANDVLAGGNFNARLMKEIRVNKGYTYGIYGSNQHFAGGGVYAIGFSTQSDLAGAAIQETLNATESLLKDGVRPDEFDLAIQKARNGYVRNFASNARLHALNETVNAYQLPDTFISEYLDRLRNVSQRGADRALRRFVRPSDFTIVSVGQSAPDFSRIAPPIAQPNQSD